MMRRRMAQMNARSNPGGMNGAAGAGKVKRLKNILTMNFLLHESGLV